MADWWRRVLDPANVFQDAAPPPPEDRDMQLANIKALQDQAAGKTPSPVDLEIAAASNKATADNYALAQTLRGRTAAGASQNGVAGAAATNSAIFSSGLKAKAEEEAAYNTQLANAINSLRNNDLGVQAAAQQTKNNQRQLFGGFLNGLATAAVARGKSKSSDEDDGYGSDGTGSNTYAPVGD